jgi:HlyD family secretion protein
MNSRWSKWAAVLLLVSLTAGCSGTVGQQDSALEASGVVEATEIQVAPEISGRVQAVLVEEGDRVEEGDPLFRIDRSMLEAQRAQAQASYQLASANLKAARQAAAGAQAALTAAQKNAEVAALQYELQAAASRAAAEPTRSGSWSQSQPSQFDLPAWYYADSEQIDAASQALTDAKAALDREQADLEEVIDGIDSGDLAAAELKLAQARAAFDVADAVRDRSISGSLSSDLRDAVADQYDSARDALDSAQSDYDRLLTDGDRDDLSQARSRVAAAQARLNAAQTAYDALQIGENAPEVKLAAAQVGQAEAAVQQAQASLSAAQAQEEASQQAVEQAQAQLDLLDLQLERAEITSPIAGVVLTRAVDPGEVMQAGLSGVTIGQLSELHITVYLPEDQYGRVSLGDQASVRVDSYPDESFDARVSRIADQAEYTPRNVQTKEERQTTVFAVELKVTNPEGKLKPGMPADVTFDS